MLTADLFEPQDLPRLQGGPLPPAKALPLGAVQLRGFALAACTELLADIEQVAQAAAFRQWRTPGGKPMSVAMTNCGALGWVSDAKGYRYSAVDPQSQQSWPAMPRSFFWLAQQAAAQAGYAKFTPDACLVNRYQVGNQLTLHQDKDEQDFNQPIVSVSLGLPAVFLFGGLRRTDKAQRVALEHGDVVVWGGPSRLRFHGVLPLAVSMLPAMAQFPLLRGVRINLTFRKAG
jgi:DNA oxidative demethylase